MLLEFTVIILAKLIHCNYLGKAISSDPMTAFPLTF